MKCHCTIVILITATSRVRQEHWPQCLARQTSHFVACEFNGFASQREHSWRLAHNVSSDWI